MYRLFVWMYLDIGKNSRERKKDTWFLSNGVEHNLANLLHVPRVLQIISRTFMQIWGIRKRFANIAN